MGRGGARERSAVFTVLGWKRSKADFATTSFAPRATYFLHAQKVGKDAHRGTNPSDKGRPPGFAPLRTPVYGGAELVPVSIDRRTVSTLCAPLGGLRPGATKLAALLPRLWAPTLGVQACGPASLTAHTPKCPARPGAPVGCGYQSIRMQKPGRRQWNRCNRGSRTPEREERSATERGDTQGGAPPWAHFW